MPTFAFKIPSETHLRVTASDEVAARKMVDALRCPAEPHRCVQTPINQSTPTGPVMVGVCLFTDDEDMDVKPVSQDTSAVDRQEFMDGLRERWETQPTEQYAFLGLTGMDYNDWLEHRHGWPVDAAGNCRIHSELEEFPATGCTVCSTLIKLYEESVGQSGCGARGGAAGEGGDVG
ncbi:hypothetical protein AB0O20_27220 [Streptomyces kronopolitis]|uniref:hypothetical protein n=1 Tax=Streptomyces kronopolitis TaxID=1612435 RepID=UPI003444340D